MTKKVYETTDRNASHRALEYFLAQRDAPLLGAKDADYPGTEQMHPSLLSASVAVASAKTTGECREDAAAGLYSVWDTSDKEATK